MKKFLAFAVTLMVAATLSQAAHAADFSKQIKARKAVMQLYAFNVGQLAAFQAKRVLVDKIPPNKIKIRRLRRFSYIINMETARQLKMFPPLDLLRYAEVINGKPGS